MPTLTLFRGEENNTLELHIPEMEIKEELLFSTLESLGSQSAESVMLKLADTEHGVINQKVEHPFVPEWNLPGCSVPKLSATDPVVKKLKSLDQKHKQKSSSVVSKPQSEKRVPTKKASTHLVPQLRAPELLISKSKLPATDTNNFKEPATQKLNLPEVASCTQSALEQICSNLNGPTAWDLNLPGSSVPNPEPAASQIRPEVPTPVFSKNCAGFPMIVVGKDRFYRHKKKTRLNSPQSEDIRWVCKESRKQKCRATVITRRGIIISTANEHNHAS